MDDYDQQVAAIHAYNAPFYEQFATWLAASGLSERTIQTHVENVQFFADKFLTYYEPLRRVDEADVSDVGPFLSDWFLRKAMWSSPNAVRSNIASFKKFFRWMGQQGHMDAGTVAEILLDLKENRDEYIEDAEAYESDLFGDW
jgi:site-specific recombinase XerD